MAVGIKFARPFVDASDFDLIFTFNLAHLMRWARGTVSLLVSDISFLASDFSLPFSLLASLFFFCFEYYFFMRFIILTTCYFCVVCEGVNCSCAQPKENWQKSRERNKLPTQ